MATTPKALKELYTALGGEAAVQEKNVPALKAIYGQLGGGGAFPDTIPEAIEKIADVADGVVIPSGTISITENGSDIDVSQYAKANVNVAALAPIEYTVINETGATINLTYYTNSMTTTLTPITNGGNVLAYGVGNGKKMIGVCYDVAVVGAQSSVGNAEIATVGSAKYVIVDAGNTANVTVTLKAS